MGVSDQHREGERVMQMIRGKAMHRNGSGFSGDDVQEALEKVGSAGFFPLWEIRYVGGLQATHGLDASSADIHAKANIFGMADWRTRRSSGQYCKNMGTSLTGRADSHRNK